jgi:putative chitinase
VLLALATGTTPATAMAPIKLVADQLVLVFPDATVDLLRRVADELNNDPATYGLDTALRRAHFFAQVRQEAGSALAGNVENFNYKPERLKEIYKYYRDHPGEAATDGRETDPKTGKVTEAAAQQTIANKVYAGRIGNGNAASGDGWSFRGRGFKQVTGRANYASTTKRYKLLYPGSAVDFEATPDLMAEFPYNLRAAVCFWIENGLHLLADAGFEGEHVDAITRIVNRDTDSYGKRRDNFSTAWAALK